MIGELAKVIRIETQTKLKWVGLTGVAKTLGWFKFSPLKSNQESLDVNAMTPKLWAE